ncbi:MAG: hypothetical protein LBH85_04540 [Treponema sp.]|jgi:hypothetical protein|nr:hypothetical protein [Treponema sp.]
MSVFCLLWIPLFFLFWSALVPYSIDASGALAFILGSVVAILQFFFGNLIAGGAFERERWIGVFVDLVALPALLPSLVYALFLLLRIAKNPTGFGSFSLLWLAPSGILRAVQWGVENDPAKLLLIPALWTSIVVCIAFLINLCLRKRTLVVIMGSIAGIALIAPLASTVYWAFFSQKMALVRWTFLSGTLALTACAIVISWLFPVKKFDGEEIVQKGGVCNT